jgi:hypothetical protein
MLQIGKAKDLSAPLRTMFRAKAVEKNVMHILWRIQLFPSVRHFCVPDCQTQLSEDAQIVILCIHFLTCFSRKSTYLMGYDDMWSGINSPTFRWNVLPTPSGTRSQPTKLRQSVLAYIKKIYRKMHFEVS